MNPEIPLTLIIMPDRLGVARFPADVPLPDAILRTVGMPQAGFVSITCTGREQSVVAREDLLTSLDGAQVEGGWRVFGLAGPLDFALVGILADISGVLAESGISIFAISTYDTDYILVKEIRLRAAKAALVAAGYRVTEAAD